MSPAVEAAWIAAVTGSVGVIGTVVVGVVGFRNTRRATQDSIQGERLLRYEERQADAYKQALVALQIRKDQRRADLLGDLADPESLKRFGEFIDSYDRSRWYEANAGLLIYATDKIRDAVDAANEAHRQVMAKNQIWKMRREGYARIDPAGLQD